MAKELRTIMVFWKEEHSFQFDVEVDKKKEITKDIVLKRLDELFKEGELKDCDTKDEFEIISWEGA
jgi:hypothetical protein